MTCSIEWEDLEVRTCKWFVYLIINSGFLFNPWHTFDKLELCLSLISSLNNLSFIYLVVLIVSMGIVIDSACFSISFLIPFLKRRWESCWDKEPLEKFTLQSKSVLEFRYGERGVNEWGLDVLHCVDTLIHVSECGEERGTGGFTSLLSCLLTLFMITTKVNIFNWDEHNSNMT